MRLETAKGQYYDDEEEVLYDTPAGMAEIERQQEALRREYAAAEQALAQLEQLDDPSALKISSVCELGIAYNDTHVTGAADFLDKKSLCCAENFGARGRGFGAHSVENQKTPDDAYVFSIGEESTPSRWGNSCI